MRASRRSRSPRPSGAWRSGPPSPSTSPQRSRPPPTPSTQALNGRPGPVVLSVAEDLLDEQLPLGLTPLLARVPPPRPTDDQIRDVLQLLASAERPVILAGAGVLRARTSNDLVRLAELLRVPVVASWRRGDVISNDHPLYLGHDRLRLTRDGSRSPRGRGRDARHRLRLGEITTFGWSVPRPAPAGRTSTSRPAPWRRSWRRPALTIASDARLFLRGRSSAARDPRRARRRVGGRPNGARMPPTARRGKRRRSSMRIPGPGRASIPARSSRRSASSCRTMRSSPPTRAASGRGRREASASGAPGRSWAPRPVRWATGCRRRSRPDSCIGTGRSWPWSATADWA